MVDRDIPEEMPPVPCPDCMHPTTHDGDAFTCTSCGQVFAHPHGMVLSQWQELWRAWTSGLRAEDDDGPDYSDPWTLTPDDMEIRRQFEDLPHERGWS